MMVDQLHYRPVVGLYDEVFAPDGQIRDVYRPLTDAFAAMGMAEMNRRRAQAEQLLRENDVTYTIYDRGGERPWQLDLFPVVMQNDDWMELERGLIQRGELLELIVRDLYGEQRLLKERVIPPSVVFGAKEFLRPAFGTILPEEPALLFFASDLARNRNGQFEVISDRVQAPSGSGYALENRIVLSRVFSGLYRESNVHRVAGYFRSLKGCLHSLAGRLPNGQGDPSIVLLSPGPQNETYFEHAYLSGYLNFALVQGEDLLVQDQRLFMKTVNGLQPVDVVFRRVEDQYMDATELRGDSLLGVPGLMEAVRGGNVRVTNPIGSAVLEDRVLFAYLNRICKFFFKEKLILPNAETLWLGDPDHREVFFEDPGNYVIKATDRMILNTFPDESEYEIKLGEIRKRPEAFVAQRLLPGSSSPVFNGREIVPARSLFRLFTTASDSGFRVMPGGLLRVSSDLESKAVTNQSGAASKDLWILSPEPVATISLLPGAHVVGRTDNPPARRENRIPNRIADDLFWMGRYAERSENNSRIFREIARTLLRYEDGDLDEQEASAAYSMLLRYTQTAGSKPSLAELEQIYTDDQRSSCPGWVHRVFLSTCRPLRAYLSDDVRAVIAQLRLRSDESGSDALLNLVQNRIVLLGSLSGMLREGMTREDGWTFIDIGTRMERALHLLYLLRDAVYHPQDEILPAVILNASDLRITHRRRYGVDAELASVLELLLFEERSPRSLVWQIHRIRECAARLPAAGLARLSIDQIVETLNIPAQRGPIQLTSGINPEIVDWMTDLTLRIEQLGDRMTTLYFAYAEKPTSVEFRDG